jgi:hypothetical protein
VSANSKEKDADHLRDDLNTLGGCGDGGSAPTEQCADLSDQRKTVDSSRNIAIGAFVVGGVAALTAGYLYWDALSHRRASATLRQKPALALTPAMDLGRSTERHQAAESFKLTLSGTF